MSFSMSAGLPTFLLSVSGGGAEGLSCPELCVCLLQAFALVGSPNALHISTCRKRQPLVHMWGKTKTSTTLVFSRLKTYRHSGRVHEALVEMFQCSGSVLLGFKPHKAELAELAVFSKLQRAVGQGAKVSKHRPEPLLLHLQPRNSYFQMD